LVMALSDVDRENKATENTCLKKGFIYYAATHRSLSHKLVCRFSNLVVAMLDSNRESLARSALWSNTTKSRHQGGEPTTTTTSYVFNSSHQSHESFASAFLLLHFGEQLHCVLGRAC
jgi:hypothetical protein